MHEQTQIVANAACRVGRQQFRFLATTFLHQGYFSRDINICTQSNTIQSVLEMTEHPYPSITNVDVTPNGVFKLWLDPHKSPGPDAIGSHFKAYNPCLRMLSLHNGNWHTLLLSLNLIRNLIHKITNQCRLHQSFVKWWNTYFLVK